MAKKLISVDDDFIYVNPTCKKYSEGFQSLTHCNQDIVLLLNQAIDADIVKDTINGYAIVFNYDDASFLIYLDDTKKLMQVKADGFTNFFPFEENELLVKHLNIFVRSKGFNL